MSPASDKVTILFLAANPVDTNPLRLGEELRDIKASLRQATHRDRFDAQDEWAVRIDDLRRALLRYKDRPVILHFAGHGDGAGIVLEGNDGQGRPVEGGALSRFIKLFPNIRCVILNACYSEATATALAEVTPCVVGMEAEVTDTYAISFAVAFYDAIGEGMSFADAFEVAKSSVDLEGGLEEVLPVYKAGTVAAVPTGDGVPTGVSPAAQDEVNDSTNDPPRLVVPRIETINGRQQGELADALVDAFGSEEELGRMVRISLNKNLGAVAGGSTLAAVAFDLVDWAKRSGYLTELIQGALATKPRNAKLRSFALAIGATERD